MIKLYKVSSIVNQFPHADYRYDGVRIYWLVIERPEKPKGLSYEEVIMDYNKPKRRDVTDRAYPESFIDTSFTLEEAEALRDYLLRVHKSTTPTIDISEIKLPIPFETVGIEAVPIGGDHDHYMLYKEEEYDLPFKVVGDYNVRGMEPSGEIEKTPSDVLVSIVPNGWLFGSLSDECVLCGAAPDRRSPYRLFALARGCFGGICLECGRRYGPALEKLLEQFYSSGMEAEFHDRLPQDPRARGHEKKSG